MKTVNRGWLRRQVQQGKMEARCKFNHIVSTHAKTDWMPARFSKGYGDFIERQMNLNPSHFTCKSGRAWREEDGTITLYCGYASYSLRLASEKGDDNA